MSKVPQSSLETVSCSPHSSPLKMNSWFVSFESLHYLLQLYHTGNSSFILFLSMSLNCTKKPNTLLPWLEYSWGMQLLEGCPVWAPPVVSHPSTVSSLPSNLVYITSHKWAAAYSCHFLFTSWAHVRTHSHPLGCLLGDDPQALMGTSISYPNKGDDPLQSCYWLQPLAHLQFDHYRKYSFQTPKAHSAQVSP